MAHIKDDNDTCDGTTKCASERRYEETQLEAREVIEESSNILKAVTKQLDAAAAKLSKYGDAPFSDLER